MGEGNGATSSFGRLGLRQVVVCRVDPSLLAWLQAQPGSRSPAGLGEVLARAVTEGLPTLQGQGRPALDGGSAKRADGAARGRPIACALDKGLTQTLAEIAGDGAPAAVSAAAVAAATAAAAVTGRKRKRSRKKAKATARSAAAGKSAGAPTRTTKARAAARQRRATPAAADTAAAAQDTADAAAAQPGRATAATSATAAQPEPATKTTAKAAQRRTTTRRSSRSRHATVGALDAKIAAELEAGELSSPALRALRESLGLSQAAAAAALGVSRGLVADAERGRRSGQPTLARLIGGLRRMRAEAESAAGTQAAGLEQRSPATTGEGG